MRNLGLAVALLLWSAPWLGAQITVEIVLDQEQFLRDEPLPIKVRVINLSGQTLTMGKDPDELTLQVESSEGHVLSRTGRVPPIEAYSLESTDASTRRVDIVRLFELGRPGRYVLTAKVRISQWGQEFVSKPKAFEIMTGLKLWEQEFGVPGAKGAPEVRKYVLQQAHYQQRLMLYVRVTDLKDAQVFRVLQVGPLVSFSRPEARIDKESNLHVLSQTGGWSFAYVVVNPDGTVLVRQRHDYTQVRPVLRLTDENKIVVAGGARRLTAEDIPPAPVTNASTNDVPSPKP